MAPSFPPALREYLRGDAPGKIEPVSVVFWHEEALKLHDALTKHGFDAVVFSQCEGTKRPVVAYAGPWGDCAWPPDGALVFDRFKTTQTMRKSK